jgi:hypothetical protein
MTDVRDYAYHIIKILIPCLIPKHMRPVASCNKNLQQVVKKRSKNKFKKLNLRRDNAKENRHGAF